MSSLTIVPLNQCFKPDAAINTVKELATPAQILFQTQGLKRLHRHTWGQNLALPFPPLPTVGFLWQVPAGPLPFVWLGFGEHHFTPTLPVDSHLRCVYSCWTSETLSWEKSLPVNLVGMELFLVLCHSLCKTREFPHTRRRGPGVQLRAGFWKMPTKLWMKGSSGFQHSFSPKACRVSGRRFRPASHFIYIHKYIYIGSHLVVSVFLLQEGGDA